MTRKCHMSAWLDELYKEIKLNDSDNSDVVNETNKSTLSLE